MAVKSTLAGLAAAAALGGLMLLGAPQKAEAGVHIGIGVPGIYFGGYPAYGYYGGGYGYYPGYYHYPRYRHHRHRYYSHGWDRPRYYKHKKKRWKRHRRH